MGHYPQHTGGSPPGALADSIQQSPSGPTGPPPDGISVHKNTATGDVFGWDATGGFWTLLNGTEWVLQGTTIDAHEDKGAVIARSGAIYVGTTAAGPTSTIDSAGSFGTSIFVTAGANVGVNAGHHTIVLTSPVTQTVLLPTAALGVRREYVIVNPTPVAKTVTSYLALTGSASTVVPANGSLTVQSDGTDWRQVDSGAVVGPTVETGAALAPADRVPVTDVSDAPGVAQHSTVDRFDRFANAPMVVTTPNSQAPGGVIPVTATTSDGQVVPTDGYLDFDGGWAPSAVLPVPVYDGQTFLVRHDASFNTTIPTTNTWMASALLLTSAIRVAEFVASGGKWALRTSGNAPGATTAVRFRATNSGGSIPATAVIGNGWTATHNDGGGTFSVALGTFTVPRAGKYRVTSSFFLANPNQIARLQLLKNNVIQVSGIATAPAGTGIGVTATDTMLCVAGDVLSIQMANGQATTYSGAPENVWTVDELS